MAKDLFTATTVYRRKAVFALFANEISRRLGGGDNTLKADATDHDRHLLGRRVFDLLLLIKVLPDLFHKGNVRVLDHALLCHGLNP